MHAGHRLAIGVDDRAFDRADVVEHEVLHGLGGLDLDFPAVLGGSALLGVDVDPAVFFEFTTIDRLARHLAARSAS